MKQLESIVKKLKSLNNISNVSIENENEIHFIAFQKDIIIKFNTQEQGYTYVSGGNAQQRIAIDKALRGQ